MTNNAPEADTAIQDRTKPSAVDNLVQEIRLLISARELSIGDALPTERELSELFSASRNTVREALQILRAFGMIETRPKVGAVISGGQGQALKKLFLYHNAITHETFHDLQVFRGYLETSIGAEATINLTSQDIANLRTINGELLNSKNALDAALADFRFHESIIALSKNQTSIAVYQMMRPVIEEVMLLGKEFRTTYQSTFDQHAEIIDALEARDRIAFAYLMNKHLTVGQQFLSKPVSGR